MNDKSEDKLITVCLSYYNLPDVMVEHVRWWVKYGEEVKRRMTFFIIDDCSKQDALSVLENAGLKDEIKKIDLYIYRVNEDMFCNIPGVRNLGATVCKSEYMVILDMDTFICDETARQMIGISEKHSGTKKAFTFNRRVVDNPKHKKHGQLHPAVCLIRVEDYWEVGGCDEDFVGNYGYTDPTFWWRSKGIINKHECRHIFLDYKDEGECDMKRDTTKNRKMFESKKKKGDWSNDFLRFTYNKLWGGDKV